MCWDTNCQTHGCWCSHWNHKCHCHEHEGFDYNWYRDWDVVWEANFQIVDKNELKKMRKNKEVWWNLLNDLIKMWFISEKDVEKYKEMEEEKRDWVMYDI